MSTQRAREPEREEVASVVIVDYGLGNLRSVTRGLERAGASVEVSDDPATFEAADGVVLPGVGAFREGVENAGPYREHLLEVAERGTPVFGICLGMQMLLTTSEEAERASDDRVGGQDTTERGSGHAGEVRGLDLVPGTNVRFAEGQKVPHMGWNRLSVKRDHPLVAGVDGEYAYFVHSYYAVPDDDAAVVATADYGVSASSAEHCSADRSSGRSPREDEASGGSSDRGSDGVEFPAIVADETGTIFGTQFHPEKSGETGLQILRNFVDICAD